MPFTSVLADEEYFYSVGKRTRETKLRGQHKQKTEV